MTEREQTILRLYGEGKMIIEIAAEVGLAPNYTGQILKRLGVNRPSKPQKKVKPVDHQGIIKCWDEGLSTSAIAERYGLNQRTIGAALKQAGRDIASAVWERLCSHRTQNIADSTQSEELP